MTPPETTPAPATLPCRHGMPPGHKCSVCDAPPDDTPERGRVIDGEACFARSAENARHYSPEQIARVEHPQKREWPLAETPTPRTEKEAGPAQCFAPDTWVVSRLFARDLERELAAANAKLQTFKTCIDAAEALMEASTDKQVEAMTSFQESMAFTYQEMAEKERDEAREQLAAEKRAHQSLIEHLESHKAQWKRHYAEEAEKKAPAAFEAIHRIAETFGLDEYTETQVAESASEILATLKQQLQEANSHCLASDTLLEAAEQSLSEAGARELALREALERIIKFWSVPAEMFDRPRQTVEVARAALDGAGTAVVRREVAEALAEALRKSYEWMANNGAPGPLLRQTDAAITRWEGDEAMTPSTHSLRPFLLSFALAGILLVLAVTSALVAKRTAEREREFQRQVYQRIGNR